VLNTTRRAGLARLATRLLRAEGVDVVSFGNADAAIANTTILIRRGQGDGARRILRALGVGRVAAGIDTLRRVDFTVLLGDDFRPVAPLHP
jgi:hypothetical protein